MPEKSPEKTGRTWADVFIAMPRYIIPVLLLVLLGMMVRTEFSAGVTKYGILGEWGKLPAASPTVDDAILGANAKMNRQLRCARLSLEGVNSRINDWKEYMEVTAETFANQGVRQSRTSTWKSDVDDVNRQITTVLQYLSGKRSSC